jgi:hypothetical protein
MTHRQWTFRNGTVHLKGPDGLTAAQQRSLARKCEALLWTDPSTLLSEDRYLLDVNFEELGEGSASSRQMWLAEMDAARCAARYADGDYTDAILEEPRLATPIDTEGSIRFRRRRRRQRGLIDPTVGSSSQNWKRFEPLWPRLLLCVRGKERLLSVALLSKVVNNLLGWILDIHYRSIPVIDTTSEKFLRRPLEFSLRGF